MKKSVPNHIKKKGVDLSVLTIGGTEAQLRAIEKGIYLSTKDLNLSERKHKDKKKYTRKIKHKGNKYGI